MLPDGLHLKKVGLIGSPQCQDQFCILRSFRLFFGPNLALFGHFWLLLGLKVLPDGLHAFSVASDKFFIEKFHVSVDCTFEKVMVIIVDISAFDVKNVVVVGRSLLFSIQTSDMEFSSVEIDLILQRCKSY